MLWSNFCLAVSVTVIVSPIVTGRAKCRVSSIRMVPGPGNWVARTVEISEPLHMPCAMTSRNMPLSEYCASTAVGLRSPVSTANSLTSSGISVRDRLA